MKIGITGVGLTELRIRKEPFYNLALEVAKRAINDAGIERREIDSFVLGGRDNPGVEERLQTCTSRLRREVVLDLTCDRLPQLVFV